MTSVPCKLFSPIPPITPVRNVTMQSAKESEKEPVPPERKKPLTGKHSVSAVKKLLSKESVDKDVDTNHGTAVGVVNVNGSENGTESDDVFETLEITGNSIYFEVTRRMLQLYSHIDNIDDDDDVVLRDLQFLTAVMEDAKYNTVVAPRLLGLGVVELCQHVFLSNFKKPELFEYETSCWRKTYMLISIVINVTDVCTDACKRILEVKFHEDLFDFLKMESLDPAKMEFNKIHCNLFDCVITVLYNVIQVVTEAREIFRDQHAVTVLNKFRTNTSDALSCIALILQAYVINDNENEQLGSAQRSFSFLAKELNSSLNDSGHRSCYGYKAREILAAINKLAINDSNKEKIVASGVLSSYVKLLQPDCSVDEQFCAAQGLWILALKCADLVRQRDGCVDGLKLLLKISDNDGVRRQARGALEVLGLDIVAVSTNTGQSVSALGDGSIFISYSHTSRERVLRLSGRLRAAGFVVWLDEDDMCDSLADDIIAGIDEASVVLVCISQKYYESPYCKKEVLFAVEKQKEIIPLTMEYRYRPHGWLLFHLGDKLRYDFSTDECFEESLRKVVRTLRNVVISKSKTVSLDETDHKVKLIRQHSVSFPPTAVTQSMLTSHQPSLAEHVVRSWTSADIMKWLDSNELQHLHDWFKDFTGELLLEYKQMPYDLPETFAACMKQELEHGRLTMVDILRLTKALRQL